MSAKFKNKYLPWISSLHQRAEETQTGKKRRGRGILSSHLLSPPSLPASPPFYLVSTWLRRPWKSQEFKTVIPLCVQGGYVTKKRQRQRSQKPSLSAAWFHCVWTNFLIGNVNTFVISILLFQAPSWHSQPPVLRSESRQISWKTVAPLMLSAWSGRVGEFLFAFIPSSVKWGYWMVSAVELL